MAREMPVEVLPNAVHGSSAYNKQVILQLQHILTLLLDGADINDIATARELHDFLARTAPSTPASGTISMYADTADNHLKIKESDGGISYWGQSFFTRKITLSANGEFNITLASYEEAVGATAMVIDFRLRSVTSATNQSLSMQFNGVTATTNYHRQSGGAGDGVALVGENPDQIIDFIPAGTSPANQWQRGKIFIHNLESGDGHVVQVMSGGLYDTAKVRNNLMGFTYSDTAAITSIRLFGGSSSTDLASGSWIKLSFIKGLD